MYTHIYMYTHIHKLYWLFLWRTLIEVISYYSIETLRYWIYKETIDTQYTIHKNRTLTHNLQQSPQKTNSLIYNKQPRKPACCKSDWLETWLLSLVTMQEANNNFCNNQPQMSRTWLITDSFLFCPFFWISINSRRPNTHP